MMPSYKGMALQLNMTTVPHLNLLFRTPPFSRYVIADTLIMHKRKSDQYKRTVNSSKKNLLKHNKMQFKCCRKYADKPVIVRLVKYILLWLKHVVCMMKTRNIYRIFMGRLRSM
jgi:hypothetical protein